MCVILVGEHDLFYEAGERNINNQEGYDYKYLNIIDLCYGHALWLRRGFTSY